MKGVAAALVGVLLSTSAHAYLKAGPNVAGQGAHHRLQGSTVGDTMATSLSAAYSFRKVRSAYAGPAVKLRRMSDSVMLDVGFTVAGDFDTAAAATHCPTTCEVETWYDQSANARHASRAGADSAVYTPNCIGTLPCARLLAATLYVQSSSVTWAAGKTSLSVVGKRTSGTGQCLFVSKGNNTNALRTDTANNWQVSDSTTASFSVAAADSAWHAGIGVIDGASSLGRIDNTETAGVPVTGSAAAGAVVLAWGAAGTVCDMTEALVWDNYALSQNERIALTQNQKDYWAPLPLDSFAQPAAAYSMRRLKSTYAGPGVKLRRVDNNQTQDINFLGFTGFTGAPIDTVAAQAHCSGTTCQIETWYDQSGNGRNASREAGISPAYVPSCNGSLPCAQATGVDYLRGPTVAWAAGRTTFSAVANRSAGPTVGCQLVVKGSNLLATNSAANTWQVTDSTTNSFTLAATDGAWHAGIGVIDGAASLGRIDGAELAGANTTGSAVAGSIALAYAPSAAVCNMTEAIVWDNYALTLSERAALTANQRGFWP